MAGSSLNGGLTDMMKAELLIQNAPTAYLDSLSIVAAITALGWDAILTFEDERIHIWKSKWSPIKCVFLVVRYLSISLQTVNGIFLYSRTEFSNQACSGYKWFQGLGGLLLVAAADIILIYRAYAFCGRSKGVLRFLIVLYIAAKATIFTLAGVFLPQYIEVGNPLSALRVVAGDCVPFTHPQAIAWIWIIGLIFQSILFTTLILRVIYTRYGAWNLGISPSPLLTVFIRDGLWAYTLIVINLVLMVIYNKESSFLGLSFIYWWFTTSSICCCRLIINLRAASQRPVSEYSSNSFPLESKSLSFRQNQVRTDLTDV